MPNHERFPNVVLVLPAEAHYSLPLAMAFAERANVFLSFVSTNRVRHRVHRIPGYMRSRYVTGPKEPLRAMSWFLNPPHQVRYPGPESQEVDLVLVGDPVVCRLDLGEFTGAVKAYWSHDSVFSTLYSQTLAAGLEAYDIVFSAHEGQIGDFREIVAEVHYLPFGYDSRVLRPLQVTEKFDLAFVGSMTPRRLNLVNALRDTFPALQLYTGPAWQHDLARIYNLSRLVLNLSRIGELNRRVFEVLGCARPLLTDYSPEVQKHFRNREHLVMYSDVEDLKNAIRELLDDEDERNRIARAGFSEVCEKHTLDSRAEEILRLSGII